MYYYYRRRARKIDRLFNLAVDFDEIKTLLVEIVKNNKNVLLVGPCGQVCGRPIQQEG